MRELPALVRTAYPDSILGRLAAAFGESWQTSRLRALFLWLLTRPYLYLTSGVHGLLERLNLRLAECDRLYASIKSFTKWSEVGLEHYGLTEKDYEDYLAAYKNVIEELPREPKSGDDGEEIDLEYVLKAYDTAQIDYEYIVALIQEYITGDGDMDQLRTQKMAEEIEAYVQKLSSTNPKLGSLMRSLWDQVVKSPENFKNKRVSTVLEEMRAGAIKKCVQELCDEYFLNVGSVMYAVEHYHADADIPNMSTIKETGDYQRYVAYHEGVKKLKYRRMVENVVRTALVEEIGPFLGEEM